MEVRRLRHAAKKSQVARLIFEQFAARQVNSSETTVDSLLAELQRTERAPKRAEVVASLQYLESLGCGKFTRGTQAKPSRMAWFFDLRTLGTVGLGQCDELRSPVPYSASVAAEAALAHSHAAGVRTRATESCPWNDILNERE